MRYDIGSNVNVKCSRGWSIGIIEKIIGEWLFIRVNGLKNAKKVNVNWVNMYF